MWSVPCNMDVESFYQPFIASATRLIVGFGLGYKDAVSVLCAFADPMHSAGYVSLASRMMLANKKTHKKKNDLGYHLAVIVSRLDGNIRVPPLRFGKYAHYSAPSRVEWSRKTRKMASDFQVVFSKARVSKPDCVFVFKSIQQNLDGVGPLKANHLISICSLLGLLPLSLFSQVEGGAVKAHKALQSHHPNTPAREEAMDNVHCAIESWAGRELTKSCSENSFCKVGRVLSGSDARCRDLVDKMFPLVLFRDGALTLTNMAGTKTTTCPSMFSVNNDGSLSPNRHIPMPTAKKSAWMTQHL